MEKPSTVLGTGGNDDNGGKMSPVEVPLGCKFDPTDEELMLYLKNKIMGGLDDLPDFIPTADVFGTSPNQMPFDSCLYSTGEKWFFYTVEPNDNLFTGDGYWTPTSEEAVYIGGQVDRYKKEFIYYHGRERPGKITNWCIHQYKLNPEVYATDVVGNEIEFKVSSVVACMVFRKGDAMQSNCQKRQRKK